MHTAHRLGKGECKGQSAGCADTGQSDLQSHGQCQLMTGEPLDDDLAHRDTCYLATHTIDGKSQDGPKDLRLVGANAQGERDGPIEAMTDGPVLDKCTGKHQDGAQDARKAYTNLVEDDATKEQQQQEYIEIAVSTGEESIFIAAPAQSKASIGIGGLCQQRFQGGHDVRKEITRHHGQADNDKGCPTGRTRIVEFSFDGLCHF